MAELADLETEREALDASLNYFVDTGARPVSLVAAPGESDKRVGGGASDPHCVTLRNGRRHLRECASAKHVFRFVRQATGGRDFYDLDEIRRVDGPEMEELVKVET